MSGAGTGYLGKTTNRQETVSKAHARADRESMWGPIDGEVTSYDAERGVVSVKPLYKPLVLGQPTEMPELIDVPLRFPNAGGGGAFTFPVPTGTRVRLTPMMRNSENYHTEDDGAPFDSRSFSLNDMEASIIGGESLTAPLQNVDPDNAHWRADDAGEYGFKQSSDGRFSQTGSQGNVYALVREAIDITGDGFNLLSTEPELVHTGEYATIGARLKEIAAALQGMELE